MQVDNGLLHFVEKQFFGSYIGPNPMERWTCVCSSLARTVPARPVLVPSSLCRLQREREREREGSIMGDALVELELSLRAAEVKLTREEERMLQTCKANGVRGFTVGAFVACGLMWTATRRLSYANRFVCSAGAAAVCGMWNCDRNLNSCLEHILAMNGSQLQSILAGIILTRHQDNSKRLQLVKKHYYVEKVFDDSSVDQPFSRWRNRNFSADTIAQRTHEEDIHTAKPKPKPNQEPVPFTISLAEDVITDPLDCILGYAKPSDELHCAETTGASLRRRHARGHKRAHRRHPSHHLENSLSQETHKQYAA